MSSHQESEVATQTQELPNESDLVPNSQEVPNESDLVPNSQKIPTQTQEVQTTESPLIQSAPQDLLLNQVILTVETQQISNPKPIQKPIQKHIPNPMYDALLNKVKEKISLITIRPSTIHLIIKHVMEEVEETPAKGIEQKEIALKLIRELIIDLTEHEDEEFLLKLLNDGTIGNLIDLITDVSKGKLNINKVLAVSKGCLRRGVPYFCCSKSKIKK
jgi:hypothetical protein